MSLDEKQHVGMPDKSSYNNVELTELSFGDKGPATHNGSQNLDDSTGATNVLIHFSPLALLGLAFASLNTWAASSGTIYIGLAAGGSTSVLYGTLFGTLASVTIALSLAELCHVMPTKGAQYHWAFLLAPDRESSGYRFLSYISGWMGTLGWVCLTSTAPLLTGQTILTLARLFHPDFTPGTWFIFSLYMAFALYAILINIFGIRILDRLNSAAVFWSLLGAFTITITLLATAGAKGTLNDAKTTFTTFTNLTGWPDGVAWFIGLLQTSYSLVGMDSVTHVIGEIANPRRNIPIAMVLACVVGGISAFVVLISFMAVIKDPVAVVAAQGGAIIVVFMDGLNSKVGASVLSSFYLVSQIFTAPALVITSTRMLQAFASDQSVPLHRFVGHVSRRTQTPVWAALSNLVFLIIIGLLLFGSSIAVQALQSSAVVLLQLSYIPSLTLHLVHGRTVLRQQSDKVAARLRLGPSWGPIINVCAIVYILLTTVFFLFPPVIPVTSGSTMNYAVVVTAIVVLLAVVNWFAFARRHFRGPKNVDDIFN